MTAMDDDRVGAPTDTGPDLLAELRAVGDMVAEGPGLAGWSGRLEEVMVAVQDRLGRIGRTARTRVLRFPPVLPREVFERSEFAESFPHLFGTVHAFRGGRREQRALTALIATDPEWGRSIAPTDFVLTPAACYPIYPLYTGRLADPPVSVDVAGYCFRHEPSSEPGRLVAFRQQEFVTIGTAKHALDAFEHWRSQALEFLLSLGLPARLEVAADPFFGAGGVLLAAGQREQHLKFEVLAPIGGRLAAVASCNQHRDHFGRTFAITAGDGPAHTSCVGFGLERIALALITAHGVDPGRWPVGVREVLWS
jgi:seryl-tRNA synthetase